MLWLGEDGQRVSQLSQYWPWLIVKTTRSANRCQDGEKETAGPKDDSEEKKCCEEPRRHFHRAYLDGRSCLCHIWRKNRLIDWLIDICLNLEAARSRNFCCAFSSCLVSAGQETWICELLAIHGGVERNCPLVFRFKDCRNKKSALLAGIILISKWKPNISAPLILKSKNFSEIYKKKIYCLVFEKQCRSLFFIEYKLIWISSKISFTKLISQKERLWISTVL